MGMGGMGMGMGMGMDGQAGGVGMPQTQWAPLEHTLGWMHYLMESVSRVSYLLGANFEALNGSFSSFLGMYEVLEPVITIIQGFTLYKIFRGLITQLASAVRWSLVSEHHAPQQSLPSGWDDEATRSNPAPSTASRTLFALSLLAGVPLAIWALNRLLKARAANKAASPSSSTSSPHRPLSAGQKVVALYDLEARSPSELTLRKGQVLTVVVPAPHPGHPEWVLCRGGGVGDDCGDSDGAPRGLVPANFISPLAS
eukprot:TRINITY_DN926_c1_g1_i3.p1 TRINITY_DN926_c1_g1~~TRINITY_DN926_c1_g1_i3.p1  ORF type:complete len:255 (-),score=55.45 TRINITY_DN926_c1_g1_i3:104-868(-)